jgi:hypothetical protein
VGDLRKKYGIFEDYSEFKFKKLAYGPRKRALSEFLALVDKYIHGAVITISVEKEIETLFGINKQQAHQRLVDALAEKGFGEWSGPSAEKVFRVCHFLAMLLSLMLSDDHKLVWYCDNDEINQDGKNHSFQDTGKIFENVWDLYQAQRLGSLGFGKSFPDKGFLDDLLSVADFAAGIVQLQLQAHANGDDPEVSEEKAALLRWIATPTTFLSKINIQISRMEDGKLGAGLVAITLK